MRRPLSITGAATVLVLAPGFFLGGMVPSALGWSRVLAGGGEGLLAAMGLAIMPALAFCLLALRHRALLVHGILSLLGTGLWAALTLGSGGPGDWWGVGIAFTLALASWILLARQLSSPWYSPRLGYWTGVERHMAWVEPLLLTQRGHHPGRLVDISFGGAFVLGPDLGEEEIVGLSMIQGSTAMDLPCAVMRRIRGFDGQMGYGVRFLPRTPEDQEKLVHMLRVLESLLGSRPPVRGEQRDSPRYVLQPKGLVIVGGQEVEMLLEYIGRDDCTLWCEEPLALRAEARVLLGTPLPLDLPGVVRWEKSADLHMIYGIRFGRLDRDQRRRLRTYLGLLEGWHRPLRRSRDPLPQRI